MDGYAAYGRVDRRRVAAASGRLVVAPEPWTPPVLGVIDPDDGVAETPSAGRRIRERLAAAREQWTITTFFLFDANSWR